MFDLNKRVVFTNDEGGVSVVIPAPGATVEQVLKAVPQGKAYEIVPVTEVPADRTFRNAWKRGEQAKKIGVDMLKAREITHARRRDKRAQEFAPHDEIIMKQIPGKDAAQAEAARQAIRTKYDAMQVEIDATSTPEALKAIITREAL